MLQGIDPVIIFQFYKLIPSTDATLAKIPITSRSKEKSTYAVIPIYLSEEITGLYVDSQSKTLDIDTENNPLTNGGESPVNQKTLGSVASIKLLARQGSAALTVLLALSELILDKTVSQEYEITYASGPVTVFGGLIHGFSYEQNSGNDLIEIKLDLARGRAKGKSVQVGNTADTSLEATGAVPPPNSPTVAPSPNSGSGGGTSVIQPRT